MVIKDGVVVKHGDKLYIGDGPREEVDHIKRRIEIRELTTFGKSELPFLIEKIVKDNEEYFVGIINKARPISTRLHQL